MDVATVELVKLIAGGGSALAFMIYVALQLRDQTRLLGSMNRKHGRTEVLQIATYEGLTGRRIRRADTSPAGYPVHDGRGRPDSDEPPLVSRTITDEDVDHGR